VIKNDVDECSNNLIRLKTLEKNMIYLDKNNLVQTQDFSL